MTAPLVAIAGTHGLDDPWWQPGSEWCEEAKRHGVFFLSEQDPFWWSTGLDGVIGKNSTWASFGASLRWYLGKHMPRGIPHNPVNLVAHSHGGQVVAYALAGGLSCHTLITVATPVRWDMRKVWQAASANMSYWVHIHGGHRDFWQIFGAIRDGRFGIRRKMPLADKNVEERGAGHSELLKAELWTSRDWWSYLRPFEANFSPSGAQGRQRSHLSPADRPEAF